MQSAKDHGLQDPEADRMLQSADLVLHNDPFRRRLTDKERCRVDTITISAPGLRRGALP
jgi:hypothetical protein